ncbi:MAG: chemotaxis protein CheA [Thermodesulfovibrio sp.]|nr:chemotaxis protein CheA [Thermodesulfovibrio sp.]
MTTDPKDIFIEEGFELLNIAEESLLDLESGEQTTEAVNNLFRVIHTFKGSAGIVGFDYLQSFAHRFENFLDEIRAERIYITSDIISLLLNCKDYLSQVLNHIKATGKDYNEEIKQKGEELLSYLDKYMVCHLETDEIHLRKEKEPEIELSEQVSSPYWHISLRFNEDFFMTGMDPYPFILYLTKLGKIVSINTLINSPSFLEFNPEKCYFGFEIQLDTELDRKAISDVFEYIMDDCSVIIIPPKSKIEEYVNLIQELPEDNELLGQILVKSGAITERELERILEIQKKGENKKIGELLIEKEKVEPQIIQAGLCKQSSIREKKALEQKSIRVDAGKLDKVLNIVGELVTITSGIMQRAKFIGDAKLDEFSSTLSRLVSDLRDHSMELRMVPIGDTFSKFKRIVRDLGKEFGKEIELEIIGGETELDKTFVEKLNDPLVHMIRNSIDHGIEKAEERIQAGKPPKGKITLKAYNESGNIVIEVTDDGRGLDREKIGKKAVEKGLITSYAGMSDQEIFNLLFLPGFSTAEKVTNISGRGVGMDVVRRNIEELKGTVQIFSEKGKFTTVRIKLPLTLAIIDGFLVEVNRENFVLPLSTVSECIDASKAISTDRHYINLRGKLLPFIDMNELFYGKKTNNNDANIVIVEYGEFPVGLVVDNIHGEIQAVIKSLGELYKNVEFFSGASILGDGSIALIVDVDRLIKFAQKNCKIC